MPDTKGSLPELPEGHVCLCNVPPGYMHTDECINKFIAPRARLAEQKQERIRQARKDLVKAVGINITNNRALYGTPTMSMDNAVVDAWDAYARASND